MANANVLEIFNSISGEVSPYHQGCLTTFVRLAGCNLHCSYCDTPNAHDVGTVLTIRELLSQVGYLYKQTGKICITGGEPLLQNLAVQAIASDYANCWIETNGTINFSPFLGTIRIVADFKFEENSTEIPYYFYNLMEKDFLKFVIENEKQLDTALNIQRLLQIGGCEASFAYSPVHGKFNAEKMLNLLLDYSMPNTIINIQIHKYLELK